jgi:glycosyltransferase involved in cell wall biosynthesis
MDATNYDRDLSVIIPIYNTSDYIAECLESLEKINKAISLNVILVNDGSNEKETKKIKEAINKYDFVNYIYQENAGVSSARNNALKHIKRTEYLMFVDSDDIAKVEGVISVFSAIKNNKTDLSIGQIEIFKNNQKDTNRHEFMDIFSLIEENKTTLQESPEIIATKALHGKIFKTDIIIKNNILFDTNFHYGEDTIYYAEYLSNIDNINGISVSQDVVYLYRSRQDDENKSLTQIMDKSTFLNSYKSLTNVENILKESGVYTEDIHHIRMEIETKSFLWRFKQIFNIENDLYVEEIINLFKPILINVEDFKYLKLNKGDTRRLNYINHFNIEDKNKYKIIDNLNVNWYDITAMSVYTLLKPFKKLLMGKKEIWMIGERKGATNFDTSYVLFKYIEKEQLENIKVIFVSNIIDGGNVVKDNTIKHWLSMVLADKLIYNDGLYDISLKAKFYKSFFFKTKEISFLQHGVIGLSKIHKFYNFDEMVLRQGYTDKFFVSSEFEKNIIEEQMGHPSQVSRVSGLTRWDNLKDNSKNNTVLFCPTWRNKYNNVTFEEFKQTKYFKYVTETLSYLETIDMEVTFLIHHQFEKYQDIFNKYSKIKIEIMGKTDVPELLKINKLLITDYSSISFDFIYMNKNVIYLQMDKEEFLEERGGSFIDYEKELPGYIASDIQDLKTIMPLVMNSDVRVDNFKELRDKYIGVNNNHSQKVYTYISQLVLKYERKYTNIKNNNLLKRIFVNLLFDRNKKSK